MIFYIIRNWILSWGFKKQPRAQSTQGRLCWKKTLGDHPQALTSFQAGQIAHSSQVASGQPRSGKQASDLNGSLFRPEVSNVNHLSKPRVYPGTEGQERALKKCQIRYLEAGTQQPGVQRRPGSWEQGQREPCLEYHSYDTTLQMNKLPYGLCNQRAIY